LEEALKKRIALLLLSFFITAVVSPHLAGAGEQILSDEAKACLGCHGLSGIVKKFENGEMIAAYVDAESFSASVHSSLGCSGCHTEFSAKRHPSRRFRSKRQYQIQCSLVCRRCHSGKEMTKRHVGEALFQEERQGKPVVCSDCHGSHSIMPAGAKTIKTEERYCLNCHERTITMDFNNGETLSFVVDKAALESSAHNELACSDCHPQFSSKEHPKRIFGSRRDYAVTSSESCRRCHFDKYTRTRASIHYMLISRGNLKAPSCTDCHGFHNISRGSKEKVSIAGKCRRCHKGIYDLYAKSIHGKALFDEHNRDVPVCTDCHVAHEIVNPLTLDYRRKIPEICRNCHTDKAIMGKYGLSTDIRTYVSDFHGNGMFFDRKQMKLLLRPIGPIAVCTDCHGTHTIQKTLDTAILKANLERRCQQCHGGAIHNIPDKWLVHYKPNMKRTPIVFLVKLIYKIFIPVLVIGLLLQIVLHIWHYAINR
jgi:predicted CXXCH cytochrome family protein